jgi:hypothetical protein
MAIILLTMHTSPFTFIKSFISFDSSLLQMFGYLSGVGFFDSIKGILIHKQDFLLIFFNGIGFILIATINPIAYLRIKHFKLQSKVLGLWLINIPSFFNL